MKKNEKSSKISDYIHSTVFYEYFTATVDFLKNHSNIVSVIVIAIFAVGVAIYPVVNKIFRYPQRQETSIKTDLTVQKIYVTLAGSVKNPGMYEMTVDDRINDVIQKSGGFAENAYTDNINLAQKLTDGQYIFVMSKEEAKTNRSSPTYSDEDTFYGIVNINTATADELCQLPGIGKSTAEKIIEYRESYDGFNNIEELMEVTGIGASKFNKIKYNITV